MHTSAGLFDPQLVTAAPYRTAAVSATAAFNMAALARVAVRAEAASPSSGARIVTLGSAPADALWWTYDHWRAWWARPDRWRDEYCRPNAQPVITVISGDASSVIVEGAQEVYTNSAEIIGTTDSSSITHQRGLVLPTVASRQSVLPFFTSPFRESEWVFATTHRERRGEQRVRTVRATRRTSVAHVDESAEDGDSRSSYWFGIDEYECLVDDANQVILRFAAVADDQIVASITIDSLTLNPDLPAHLFQALPESGAHVIVP